jgi:MFS family permease
MQDPDHSSEADVSGSVALSSARTTVVQVRGAARRQALRTVTVAWMFGAVWMTATAGAPLTLFAKHLGASEFQFGLLAAMPFLASLLSLPASLVTEHTGHRKGVFFAGLYTQRLLWIPVSLVPLWIAWNWGIESGLAIGVFLVLVFLMHAGQAVGGPAWVNWMADIVPARSRGTYFSRRRQLGTVTAVPTALVVGLVLDHYRLAEPMTVLTCVACVFLVAMVPGVIDIALFHRVPHEVRTKPSIPLRQLMLKPLRDREFLWFGGFVATLVFAVSFMGQFITLFLIQKLNVSNTGTQLMLLAVPMLAQMAVLPMWGRVVDRMGKKPALVIAALGLVPVGMGWCLMNSGAIWLGYLLSAMGAALWVGVETANLDLILEFGSSGDDEGGGTSYVAVNTVILNIAGFLGGISSGIVATWLRDWTWDTGISWLAPFSYFEALFFISAMMRLMAVVVFLPHVHEHDARPTLVALKFMTGNFYNNLNSFVSQPLKLLRRRGRRES